MMLMHQGQPFRVMQRLEIAVSLRSIYLSQSDPVQGPVNQSGLLQEGGDYVSLGLCTGERHPLTTYVSLFSSNRSTFKVNLIITQFID